MSTSAHPKISQYRLELLPIVPAFHRKARNNRSVEPGDLVYYGPAPSYYGIGEVKGIFGRLVVVDFRGTGAFGVHEDLLEIQYLIPVTDRLAQRI
ncbi:MAG: hypothetical protein EB075_02335 [Bacteroidetes bacterium]|jgi:hypothetical protein|nr:hypothetical protein [Bacteroidota bacterium]